MMQSDISTRENEGVLNEEITCDLHFKKEEREQALIEVDEEIADPLQGKVLVPWDGMTTQDIIRSYKFQLFAIVILAITFLYFFLLGYSIDEVSDEINRTSYHSYNFRSTRQLDKAPKDPNKPMRIELRILDIDLMTNSIKTRYHFFPSQELVRSSGQLRQPIAYQFRYQSGIKGTGQVMTPVDVMIPIQNGSYYYYPWDQYSTELSISVSNGTNNLMLPLEVDVISNTPSLWLDLAKVKDINSSDSQFKISISISRPDFVVMFSLFIAALMWCLSLAYISLSMSIIVLSTHRPSPPHLALGMALIFSIPKLREAQPGIPPIGILIDVIGFFW